MIHSITKPMLIRKVSYPPDENLRDARILVRTFPRGAITHPGEIDLVEETVTFAQHASVPGGPLAAARFRK